jgi:outer membrane protein W
MRLNGNLVLNAGGLSEIQNAVVERVTVNPSFSASEKGRFIFRTDEGKVYYNDGVQWVAIATGGNAAALQAEVDSLEAALGAFVTTTGSFDALGASLTNVTGATSVTNVIEQLDAAISALNSALQTEVSRAESAESQLQFNIDTETTARQAADLTLQQNINAEEVARIDADTALQAAVDAAPHKHCQAHPLPPAVVALTALAPGRNGYAPWLPRQGCPDPLLPSPVIARAPLCQAIATPLAMASAITAATTLPVLEGLSGFTNDISLSTKKRPTRRGARVQCHGLASRRICQLHCFLKEVY